MTISLDELEELAKAAAPSCGVTIAKGNMLLSGVDGGYQLPIARFQFRGAAMKARYYAACDPARILKLLAVVKAAKAMVARVDKPQWVDLRDAINAPEAT